MATIFYFLWYVAQASFFAFCMYRVFSLGRAYERWLREKYPDVAEKRRTDPLYRMTFPGMPVIWHVTGEAELTDPALPRMRKASICYFVAALVSIWLPAVTILIIRGLQR